MDLYDGLAFKPACAVFLSANEMECAFEDHMAGVIHVKNQIPLLVRAAAIIKQAWAVGGKLFLMGNGGSASDAQHIAAELIGRYQKERCALPALALTTDSSILTALGNDFGFDIVFARQLEGLANANDVVLGISTSGNSKNIVLGIEMAINIGCKTLALTGETGLVGPLVNLNITIPGLPTPRVQEAHIFAGHLLCELLD